MSITFQGKPVTLYGKQLTVGDNAPDFTLTSTDLKPVTLSSMAGKNVFVVVPSIDTPVCDMEVRKFNTEATKFKDVTIYVVSLDLPFAQVRWCGAAGIDKVITLSDYMNKNFGKAYGVLIEEIQLLTRSIFVVDENNKITYVEYCPEITSEPNYEEALAALNKYN